MSTPSPEREVCRGCGEEIDPGVCWCGMSPDDHTPWYDGHSLVPMGCHCGRVRPGCSAGGRDRAGRGGKVMGLKVTIQHLRKRHPAWTWQAARSGMGWQYEGRKGSQRVRLQAHAVLCGPTENDFETRWVVYEEGQPYAASYILWSMREEIKDND